MRIVCKKKHFVDQDDDGRKRWAKPGDRATAVRNLSVPPSASDAWHVLWNHEAWGFYTDEELREVAK